MGRDLQVDVVVVGAGATGASFALTLAENTELTIALLEGGGQPSRGDQEHFDSRVLAISPSSQVLLQGIGVWQRCVAERVCPYTHMTVWDGEGTGRVEFDCADNQADALGYIVENSVLVNALRDSVATHPNIEFIQGADVLAAEAGRLMYQTAGASSPIGIGCQLIVAADGAESTLRKYFAMRLREWSYDQRAIVCTVHNEHPHEFTCWQRFTQTGPLALLPLCSRSPTSFCEPAHFSSLVWTIDQAHADDVLALGDEAFCQRLTNEFEYLLGSVTDASPRLSFSLRQRHAPDYIRPGFALLGDAAHTIHPLAGQGANLGFADVAVLVEELARAQRLKIPLQHPSLLQRYQRRRKSHNLATMVAMEGFKHLFSRDELAWRWLRNTGMNMFNAQSWLKRRVAQIAAGHF